MADTIVALSSGTLPAAIAIVRLSGPRAFDVAAALGVEPRAGRVRYATLRDPHDGSAIDEAIVLGFCAPASATGEDVVEFHVHGSIAVVDRLLAACTAQPGVRIAQAGEYTRRAMGNGKMDLVSAEALGDLLHAETETQRRAALQQFRSGFGGALAAIEDRLLTLSAMAEAAIDYVGDDEEVERGEPLSKGVEQLRCAIETLLASPDRRPLQEGVRTVLAGPVNAGKSSLLNALVGFDRAITSEEEGTTRDTIEHPIRIDDIKFLLVDTAGWREQPGTIEREGIERARREVDAADILLWLGSPGDSPKRPRTVAIQSKADLHTGPSNALSVSATTGEGLVVLRAKLVEVARTILPAEDEVTVNARQRAHLRAMATALDPIDDPVLIAEGLRQARHHLSELRGQLTLDDVLDRIFGKFCLGK